MKVTGVEWEASVSSSFSYQTSLTVSLTWNSHPSFLLLQSIVAMWPFLPPMSKYLQEDQYTRPEGFAYCIAVWACVCACVCSLPPMSGVVDAIWTKGVQFQTEELQQG